MMHSAPTSEHNSNDCFLEKVQELGLNIFGFRGGQMNFSWGMRFTMQITAIACAVVISVPSSAQSKVPVTASPTFSEYFTVDENNLEEFSAKTRARTHVQMNEPLFGSELFIQKVKKLVVNLLKWTLHEEELPIPSERYIRKLHFGRWINDPNDNTCMNTRARVLVRDSQAEVTFRANKRCVVENGLWQDPYTGEEVTSSRKIQIDHIVPLKNAYVSGAWRWDYKTRCLYANYMGYENHLISSGSHENMSKGDRGPEKYLPPNTAYRCQYVRNWLTVKLIWQLTLNPDEVQAIHSVVNSDDCDPSLFRFTKEELEAQREDINSNIEFCMINKR